MNQRKIKTRKHLRTTRSCHRYKSEKPYKRLGFESNNESNTMYSPRSRVKNRRKGLSSPPRLQAIPLSGAHYPIKPYIKRCALTLIGLGDFEVK